MPKVRGIERFAEAMRNCKGGYVLIGGGACSVLFDIEGDSFRATEDLDVVVIVDGETVEFASALWAFIKDAEYKIGKGGDGGCTYYRFRLPEGSKRVLDCPGQIELFARHPDLRLKMKRARWRLSPLTGSYQVFRRLFSTMATMNLSAITQRT